MTQLSVADVLDRAADLIEPEGAWTKNWFGKDANGQGVDRQDLDRAVCFCTRGALLKAGDDNRAMVFFAHNGLGCDDGYSALNIASWNDAPERTQAEVVAKLREAAALARAGEA